MQLTFKLLLCGGETHTKISLHVNENEKTLQQQQEKNNYYCERFICESRLLLDIGQECVLYDAFFILSECSLVSHELHSNDQEYLSIETK